MPLTLTWKGPIGRAIAGEGLRPDTLNGPAGEVARLPVPAGNGVVELGELFQLKGDGGDGHLIFEGDLRPIGGLASGMTSGTVEIQGDAGPRLGSGMTGGSIVVSGSVGIWAGAEIRGGSLRIGRNAGNFLGGALPGSRLGMRDGVILVDGDAGDDVGLLMRRGLIAVRGQVGRNLGRNLVAGSIFGFGSVGRGAGRGMKRGTLGLFGDDEVEISPTFEPSGSFRPHVLPIYLNQLRSLGFDVPESAFRRAIVRYNGDRVEGGRGEIWLASRSDS